MKIEKREFTKELFPCSDKTMQDLIKSALSTDSLQDSLFLDVNNNVLHAVVLLPEDILSCGCYRGQFLLKT